MSSEFTSQFRALVVYNRRMEDIRHLKLKARRYYSSLVSIQCPLLGEPVFFTSEGFNHLIYRSNRKPRNINEQFMKLKCLFEAPKVIKACAVISDTRKLKRKINGVLKDVTRYELVHEIEKGIKMRVVVERIGTGRHKFLSIMPHNKSSKMLHTSLNKQKRHS